jgi:hypothetical protein
MSTAPTAGLDAVSPPMRLYVLALLKACPVPLTSAELARRAGTSPSSVAGIIKDLQLFDFVTRVANGVGNGWTITPSGIEYGDRHFEAQRMLEALWHARDHEPPPTARPTAGSPPAAPAAPVDARGGRTVSDQWR